MTISHSRKALLFSLGLLYLVVSCGHFELQNKTTTSPESNNISNGTKTITPQVEMQWIYEDEHRLALELVVHDYLLPEGFSVSCPVTRIELKSAGGQIHPVYVSADLTTLDDFYDITQNSRWFCAESAGKSSKGSYKFSFMYFYNKANETIQRYSQVKIELGKVYATNNATQIVLSPRGEYSFTLLPDSENQKLTWVTSSQLTDDNVTIQITRVAVNRSFASLDACIEYNDHHYWRPRAGLVYEGQIINSTEYRSTYPFPYDRDTTIKNNRRCYAFTLPYTFPLKALKAFRIGIADFAILLNDSSIMTMNECNEGKERLSILYPDIKICCFSFDLHERKQTWFEITEFPKLMPREKAYELVETAFISTIIGPWYIDVTQ